MSTKKHQRWKNLAVKIIVNTIAHPVDYAKALIQIGYEPINPIPIDIFGNQLHKLPNVFEYIKYIQQVDGVSGTFVGFTPKICGVLLGAEVAYHVDKYKEESQINCQHQLRYDLLSHTAAIIVSQPFQVISLRMMAQFVGREMQYTGMLGSIKEIYTQGGVGAFFDGIVPRLIGDLSYLLISGSCAYVVSKYMSTEKNVHPYTEATIDLVTYAVLYPFQVISSCMAVTNSGLAIASTPFAPHYSSWMDCWTDLYKKKQLNRGISLLLRFYSGPTINIGGKLFLL